jgi:tetratricopeptide (TPR) repeat protein
MDDKATTSKKPLIGRTREIEDLEELLGKVIEGRTPAMVSVIGNNGIGKTRLLTEFLGWGRERYRDLRVYRGIAQERGRPYGVFSKILRTRFGIHEAIAPEKLQEQFRREISDIFGDRRVTEFLHFLGSFVDIRFPDNPFLKTMEEHPEQFEEIRRTILQRFFEEDARKKPLILTFEDLQFATEEALSLIRYLGENLKGVPILIVCVSAPDLFIKRPDWFERPVGHARIELGPLSRINTERLLSNLLPQFEDLPDQLVQTVCNMSGGNPFFLEQLVQILKENRTIEQDAAGRWQIHLEKLKGLRLPLSVEEAIQVRNGALTPAEREILEKALCMGSVFWLGGLVALKRLDIKPPPIWGGTEDVAIQIRELLDGLVKRDYIMQIPDSTFQGDVEYAFKHNLEREMIRRMANPATLRRYHAYLAEWLEYQIEERGEEQLDMIASHLKAGGRPQKAAMYWFTAGNHARSRYAFRRAARYYRQARECMEETDVVLMVELLHNHGDVQQASGDTPGALETFELMRELAWRMDSLNKAGAAHNRIGRVHREAGRLDEALRHLGAAMALFRLANDERGIASSLDDVGKVHWLKGDYDLSFKQMSEALELRKQLGDPRSIALSLNNIGLVKQDSGVFQEAILFFQESLKIRREIHDVTGIITSLNNLGTVYVDKGDQETAVNLWREGLDEAKKIDDKLRQTYLLTNIGVALYHMERYNDAVDTLAQAAQLAGELGDRLLIGETARALGKTHALMGDHQRAREYLDMALETFTQLRSKVQIGIALRTLAEVILAGGWSEEDERKAEEVYLRSIRTFEDIGNDLEMARSLKSYSNLLNKQGRVQEAEKHARRAQAIFTQMKVTTEPVEREAARISVPGDSSAPHGEGA